MSEPPTADKPFPDYGARTVMFGDGEHGSAMQIAEVTRNGQPTGIMITWRRKRRAEPGITTYEYKEERFASVNEAIEAYEKDHPRGKPQDQ